MYDSDGEVAAFFGILLITFLVFGLPIISKSNRTKSPSKKERLAEIQKDCLFFGKINKIKTTYRENLCFKLENEKVVNIPFLDYYKFREEWKILKEVKKELEALNESK